MYLLLLYRSNLSIIYFASVYSSYIIIVFLYINRLWHIWKTLGAGCLSDTNVRLTQHKTMPKPTRKQKLQRITFFIIYGENFISGNIAVMTEYTHFYLSSTQLGSLWRLEWCFLGAILKIKWISLSLHKTSRNDFSN